MTTYDPEHWQPRDQEEEEFLLYLNSSGLAERTIREYQKYFRIFPRATPPDNKIVHTFLDEHAGNIAKAFVNIYLEFKRITTITIPKKRGRVPVRIQNLISESEYLRLQEAMYQRNTKWGLMLDITYWCGLRREEVCNMQPAWILLEEYQQGKPLRIHVEGKGSKQRIAVLPADAAELLMAYILQRFEEMELGNEDRIFGVGTHYWWEVLTQMSKRVLGKRYKPHELRHTRATRWLQDGVDLLKISKRLGHSSIATTQRYTHMSTEEVASDWEKEMV